MKKINFITPLTPDHARELRLWAVSTVILVICTLIAVAIITGTQWHIHRGLVAASNATQTSLTSFQTSMNQQRSFTSEYEALQQKIVKATHCAECPKNPLNVIETIRKATSNAPLQSVSISKKNIELQALCTTSKQAMDIMKKLSESNTCNNIKLVSLKSSRNQLLATISAVPIKKTT